MIYNLQNKFLFVHIPRTSGTSMTSALSKLFPNSFVGKFELKHARVRLLHRNFLGKHWHQLFKFSVIRNPWDIVESDWRHTHYNVLAGVTECPSGIAPWWFSHVQEAAAMTFEQYVQTFYLSDRALVGQGGFWHTYCCRFNGKELGVIPFLYTEVETAWDMICENLGVHEVPTYPRENDGSMHPRGQWTPALIQAVGERCNGDIERFGFLPPEI